MSTYCAAGINDTPIMIMMLGGAAKIFWTEWFAAAGVASVFGSNLKAFFQWKRKHTVPDVDLDIHMREDLPPELRDAFAHPIPPAVPLSSMSVGGRIATVVSDYLFNPLQALSSTMATIASFSSLAVDLGDPDVPSGSWLAYNCFARQRMWDANTKMLLVGVGTSLAYLFRYRDSILPKGRATATERLFVLAMVFGAKPNLDVVRSETPRWRRRLYLLFMLVAAVNGLIAAVCLAPVLITHYAPAILLFPLSSLQLVFMALLTRWGMKPFWGNSLHFENAVGILLFGGLVVYLNLALTGSQITRWSAYGGDSSYFMTYLAEWNARTWDAYVAKHEVRAPVANAFRRLHEIW